MTTNDTKRTEYSGPGGGGWNALYAAADRLRAAAPWDYFCELDIAEVAGPAGQFFFSIGGMFGEDRTISVYRGERGLAGLTYYLGLKDAEVSEALLSTRRNCLQLSWGRRERLRSRDRKILYSTGHTYRGAQEWPLFRSLQIGWEDWYLTDEEAEAMAFALEELANGLDALKETHDQEELAAGNRMVRTWNDDIYEWETGLEPPVESVRLVTQGCVITDEVLLRRLRKSPLNGVNLELESAFIPVLEGKKKIVRGNYKRLSVLCDADTLMLIRSYYPERGEANIDIVLETFIQYIDRNGRPDSVTVRDTVTFGILKHLCDSIDVEIYVSPALEAVDAYITDLLTAEETDETL